MQDQIIIYGHSFCPEVHTVKAVMDHLEIAYKYIDIRKDEAARGRVKEINQGFESVPTLVFEDGSTLTEPSEDALYLQLESLGYRLDPPQTSDRIKIALHNPVIAAFGVGVVIGGGLFGSLSVTIFGLILILLPILIRLLG